MREADFEVLLHLVERLSDEQRTARGRALASASGEPEAVRLIEGALAAAPRCPPRAARAAPRRGCSAGATPAGCAATAAKPAARPSTP
jgi:hypothetical protein